MLKTLAFFAHPDDETMLIGGTLAYLALQGAEVHYLCATRGEGGEVGQPPLCTQQELGKMREKELACAVQALGGKELSFLDYQDPVIGPEDELYAFTENEDELIRRLQGTIINLDPEVIITHGTDGEYGHPGHVLANRALLQAVRDLEGYNPVVYTVAAFYEGHPRPRLANESDRADLVLDISPVRYRKVQAATCHRTQHALFLRHARERRGEEVTLPEIIRDQESLSRALPENGGDLDDPAAELLRSIALERGPD